MGEAFLLKPAFTQQVNCKNGWTPQEIWQIDRILRADCRIWVDTARERFPADFTPASGASHPGLHRPVLRTLRQERPGQTRVLSGQRHSGDIHVAAPLEASRPGTLGIGLLVDDAQVGAGAVHEERAHGAITLLGDRAKPCLAATQMLSRGEAQGSGIVAPTLEDVGIAHAGDQGRGGLRPDRRDLHEPACRLTLLRQRADLLIVALHMPVERAQLFKEAGEHLARQVRQAVFGILEDPRQLPAQARHPLGTPQESADLVHLGGCGWPRRVSGPGAP